MGTAASSCNHFEQKLGFDIFIIIYFTVDFNRKYKNFTEYNENRHGIMDISLLQYTLVVSTKE